MNVLVIGRGGREHAICRKVKESSKVEKVFVAPGNAGMIDVAQLVQIDESNQEAACAICKGKWMGLAIIGPEVPLLAGLADRF